MARQRPCRHWRPTSASVRPGVGCEYYHFLVPSHPKHLCGGEGGENCRIVSFSHAVFHIVTHARYVSSADAGSVSARQGWLSPLGWIARVY